MKLILKKSIIELYNLIIVNRGSGYYLLNGHYFNKPGLNPSFDNILNEITIVKNLGDLVSWNVALDEMIKDKDRKGSQFSKKSFSFSFDDGFKEISDFIIPAFNNFQIKVGVFIVPSFVGYSTSHSRINDRLHSDRIRHFMSWDDLKIIVAQGHSVGNHSLSHLDLSKLTSKDLEYDIQKSKDLIESNLNSPCNDFAIPYGRKQFYSDRVLAIVKKYHRNVFTSDRTDKYNHALVQNVFNRQHFELGDSLSDLKFFTRHNLHWYP